MNPYNQNGSEDEPNIVFTRKSQEHHNTELKR